MTTDFRALCAELLADYEEHVYRSVLADRARAALAEPVAAALQRPESFEFALDFLGDPEASELRAYIEQLEARAAELDGHG